MEKRQLISDTVPFFLYIQVTHLQRSPRSATRSPGRWPTLRTLPVCWTVEQSAWQPESAWTAAAKASAHAPATSATWAQGQHKGGSSLSRSCCRLPRQHLFMSWYPTMKPTRCVRCFWCFGLWYLNYTNLFFTPSKLKAVPSWNTFPVQHSRTHLLCSVLVILKASLGNRLWKQKSSERSIYLPGCHAFLCLKHAVP